MEIGIGLPSTIPGTSGRQIVEWAMAAEERGFSTLGVIDRLVYGNSEPHELLLFPCSPDPRQVELLSEAVC